MTKMHYTIEDKISLITLDDGKMNVMNWEFFKELNDSLDRTLADKACAVIFTGRQGIFSAGLDLKLLPTLSTFEEQLKFQKTFASTMMRVFMFPVPTIAAYAGHSIAGGAILSYACDRFMVFDGPYKIQINEVANKMLIPSWISLICRSSIPPQWWKEALLHSRAYTPREAFERGIVDDLIKEERKVIESAKALAKDLFKLDGRAYAFTKKFMRQEEVDNAMKALEKELLEWQNNA
jgi:enoyl-CoA hydratase